MPRVDLTKLSDQHGWPARLAQMGVTGVSPGNKQDAIARFQNRALNFVQSIRLRELVDRVTVEMLSSPEKLVEFTTVTSKNGFKRDLRPLVDLVNSANVAQQMTQRALQDHKENETSDKEAMDGNQLSIAVESALEAAMNTGTPSSEIVKGLNEG